jgi:hypothetical protein
VRRLRPARRVTVRRPPAPWRQHAARGVLMLTLPVVVALCGLGQYWAAAGLGTWAVVTARLFRRWPWTAAVLFRLELARTRHENGETVFAYPLTAPVQRRRPVPREAAAPEVTRGD